MDPSDDSTVSSLCSSFDVPNSPQPPFSSLSRLHLHLNSPTHLLPVRICLAGPRALLYLRFSLLPADLVRIHSPNDEKRTWYTEQAYFFKEIKEKVSFPTCFFSSKLSHLNDMDSSRTTDRSSLPFLPPAQRRPCARLGPVPVVPFLPLLPPGAAPWPRPPRGGRCQRGPGGLPAPRPTGGPRKVGGAGRGGRAGPGDEGGGQVKEPNRFSASFAFPKVR